MGLQKSFNFIYLASSRSISRIAETAWSSKPLSKTSTLLGIFSITS